MRTPVSVLYTIAPWWNARIGKTGIAVNALSCARAQRYVVIASSQMSKSRPRTMRRNALMITGTSSNSNSKPRGLTVPSTSGCVWPRTPNAVFRRLVTPFILLHNAAR